MVDGVLVLVPAPAGLLRGDGLSHFVTVGPAALALLHGSTDSDPLVRHLEWRSIWGQAHWGDRVQLIDGEGTLDAPFGFEAFVPWLRSLPLAEHTVDLGCGFGRAAVELPAHEVVALDLAFDALRMARSLSAGEAVRLAVRQHGRHYRWATVAGRAAPHVRWICADILDPPLVPESFDRVVSLNTLDSVSDPSVAVSVIQRLCAPGGEVIVGSPFAWQSHLTPDDERPEGDPVAWLLACFGEGWTVLETREIPWWLPRDGRSSLTYRSFVLRARKG